MFLVLLVACGGKVEIQPGQAGCTDYNFEQPEESRLSVSMDGDVAVVQRTNVLIGGTAPVFEPEISVEGDVITVEKAWTGTDETTSFCYLPQVTVTGVTGKLQVRWFLEDDGTTPFDTVNLEP